MKLKREFYSDEEEKFYRDILKKYEVLRARRKALSKKRKLTEGESFELEWNKPTERHYKTLLGI